MRLGADAQGVLRAIGHESWSHGTPRFEFCEPAAVATRSLYAGAHRMTRQRSVALDLPVADSCRAPGEAVGLLALESAMDELAHQLGIDPIELRIRNEPEQDPQEEGAFLEPPVDRLHARRRAALWLGRAEDATGSGARRPLADRRWA